VPTLIVIGDEDTPEIEAQATVLAERVPRAQRVTIANTAHLPPLERPVEFNRILLDWLATLPAQGPEVTRREEV
jgi:pimeloyl-ACP methyl ester carboxylesterase